MRVNVLDCARAEPARRPGRSARRLRRPPRQDSLARGWFPWLVSYAVGALLGISMLAMLPESLEQLPAPRVLRRRCSAGILLFFMLEKLVLWRHCHTHDCEVHESTVAPVMIGDTFHNFVDGAVIGAAVLTSVPLGVSTAIAVAAHEIPQELGDFAILLHAGYSRRRRCCSTCCRRSPASPARSAAFLAFDIVPRTLPYFLVDCRVQLPLRGDGGSHPGTSPRTNGRRLAPPDRPDRARDRDDGLVYRLIIDGNELLDAFPVLDLARVDVPLRIHSDRVDPVQLARIAAVSTE